MEEIPDLDFKPESKYRWPPPTRTSNSRIFPFIRVPSPISICDWRLFETNSKDKAPLLRIPEN